MSNIGGGYHCLEDKARDMCAEIISIFATDRGPYNEPIPESTRQVLAVDFLTSQLRELTAERRA